MAKKILSLVLVIALTAAIAISGTIAYLTAQDSEVNVMTVGSVDIEQNETDANGNPFEQGQDMYPGTTIDKHVTVTNTGKSDAYVRTLIAFETVPGSDTFGYTYTSGEDYTETPVGTITVDGVTYDVVEFVYNKALAAGEKTGASLQNVKMSEDCTNEDMAALGDTFEILVLSQACQTENMGNNPVAALDTAFGEANEANIKLWFGDMYIPDYTITPATVENGTVTVPAGETQVLSGSHTETITVKGGGTLYLRDLKITAAEGSALVLAENTTVKLIVENDVTLTGAAGGNGISVPANTTLDLSGKGGSLTAIGNNGTDDGIGGSGIGGEGVINIHDLKDLTAEGWGKHAFGIGGASTSITISNTGISYVKGGYVQPNFIIDTKYGKDEPEGGAAIGSYTDGAVINLTNVTIDEAQGGSKAAGIGASYWTGVTINIANCDIKNVQGGNASAGIGGSRVESDATNGNNAVSINISNSKVTAYGGQFAAGIGSGYDTHCQSNQPVHTINITGDSVINAVGGKYAAGIGTGYHVASLAGKIENTVVVNAENGGSREKYTYAMDVGFGVIDKTREAANNESSFDYQGTQITVDRAPDVK